MKTNQEIEKEVRNICTYHADEGTCGYLLSEEQFEKIQNLIAKIRQEDKDNLVKELRESMNNPHRTNCVCDLKKMCLLHFTGHNIGLKKAIEIIKK